MGRGTLTAIIIFLVLISIVSIKIVNNRNHENTITVCTAGSMAKFAREISQLYAEKTGADVRIRSQGSVDIVRGLIDLGLKCDVVIVADYRLIPLYLYPNYTDWYVVYASNEMVIAWSNNTRAPGNLLELVRELESGDVTFGISDPNRDPCGYRAVGVLGLLSIYYNDTKLLNDLMTEWIPGSRIEWINNTLNIYIPPNYTPKGNLIVRPKSIQLISLLETGEIKYAILYRNEAVQHRLNYLDLPVEVNLGDPHFEASYSRVIVHILSGTSSERSITMAPIAYGVTVPGNSANVEGGLGFVKFLLEHRNILVKYGFVPVDPPIGFGNIPGGLEGVVGIGGG